MTGFNGWNSARHAEGNDTTLLGDKLKLRLEYSPHQTAITFTDERAPKERRCVCYRTDRRTGQAFVGHGRTQRAAGEAALEAMGSPPRPSDTIAKYRIRFYPDSPTTGARSTTVTASTGAEAVAKLKQTYPVALVRSVVEVAEPMSKE